MENDTVVVPICERQLIPNWLSLNFHCSLYSKHNIGSKDALCFVCIPSNDSMMLCRTENYSFSGYFFCTKSLFSIKSQKKLWFKCDKCGVIFTCFCFTIAFICQK